MWFIPCRGDTDEVLFLCLPIKDPFVMPGRVKPAGRGAVIQINLKFFSPLLSSWPVFTWGIQVASLKLAPRSDDLRSEGSLFFKQSWSLFVLLARCLGKLVWLRQVARLRTSPLCLSVGGIARPGHAGPRRARRWPRRRRAVGAVHAPALTSLCRFQSDF